MSLKQHNDIVEKLLKRIDEKDEEIQGLKKEIVKASGMNGVQAKVKGVEGEKEVNKRINQLHKEYKDKINLLTQQIRSKSNENKDLKQRLTAAKNIEAKQKEQISEILKKTANIASYDPKFAAVVSHYESQLQKKNKYIGNLQKQIKQSYYELAKGSKGKRSQQIQNQQQNDEPLHQNIVEQSKIPNMASQDHYHTKYQQEITSLKESNNKYQRLLEEKSKEFKDLTKRYSELTKEYYRLLNQYGEKESKIDGKVKGSQGQSNFGILRHLDNVDEQEQIRSIPAPSETSLSFSFLSNYPNPNAQPSAKPLKTQTETELQVLQSIIAQITELLGLENRIQIVPTISRMKSKIDQISVYESISRFVQSMLYRLGYGKVPMSGLVSELEKFQIKMNRYVEASELLDQICIEIGAKKDKLLQKLNDLKASQEQLFNNMKDLSFMQKLPKANKISQFIEYFQLDKEICQLPDQLKKMYDQLRYVDRFIKQASVILEREPQGLERFFQFVLRYIERKQAERFGKGEEKEKGKQGEKGKYRNKNQS